MNKNRTYTQQIEYIKKDTRIYALYKGENIIAEGTIVEIANQTSVAPQTVKFYQSPAYQRRVRQNGNSRMLVCLGDDDE